MGVGRVAMFSDKVHLSGGLGNVRLMQIATTMDNDGKQAAVGLVSHHRNNATP